MKSLRRTFRLALLGTWCLASAAQAQWFTQSFPLAPGWNSVFLEVDPSPGDADALFAGLPIETVWTPVPPSLIDGPPDCADPDDPGCVPPETSGWWVWVPGDDPHAIVRDLRLIRGGRVYLIKATAATVLTVTGRPSSAVREWKAGFNLAGFYVVDDVNAAPTFVGYLSGSAAHGAATVFRVEADGSVAAVADPGTTNIAAGVGYWVQCGADTAYDGPVAVDRGSLRGIDYAEDLVEYSLRIQNLAGSPRDVTIAYASSSPVPAQPSDLPSLAGDVPLSYLEYQDGPVAQALQWQDLTTNTWNLAAAGSAAARDTIRLGVQRAGLAPATVDGDGAGSMYQGLLRVTDQGGYERWLPVSTEVPSGVGGSVAGAASPRPGLYFGHVSVDHVAWITAGAPVWTNDDPTDPTIENNPDQDTATLRPASAEFSFPVLIHVSDGGVHKLLTEVALLWKPGDAKLGIPGEYVLATPACDPAVCDALEAGSLQDGRPFARRISTAAFAFDGDLSLSGSAGTLLTGQTVLPADHRLNPFRHRYHADHDCDAEGECFEIIRDFSFDFAADPPTGLDSPGWGDSVLAGTYLETLTGLHKAPVGVRGRFELRRVSNVASLNAD